MDQVQISQRLTTAGAAALAARMPAETDTPVAQFEAIYVTYAPLLRRISMRKFSISRGDAEALVHDVFATYLSNPANVRDLHAYLIGAICNASRQHLRRDSRERTLFCDSPVCGATPADEVVDGVVRNVVVNAVLARLGPSCRDTLERVYLGGESAPTIAQSRNTSANYIRRLLSFCRGRLQAIYSEMRDVHG